MKTYLSLCLCFFIPFSFLTAQTINLDFPSVNGQVYALAAKGDTLFIGGDFIEVDETPRSNIAAIDLNTGNLLDWNPVTNDKVDCMVIGGNVLYICGEFQTVNSTARNTLAALDATTGDLLDWNPDIVFPGIPGMQTGRVSGIGVFETFVFIGGYFISVNGQDRSNMAALHTDGVLESFNPVFDAPLDNIVIDDHIMYISGPFSNIDGQEHLSFATFGMNALNLTSWDPMVNNSGNTNTVVYPTGEDVFIAGFFNNVGGESREMAAKLDFNTAAVQPWHVNFINALPIVNAFAMWEDKLYMGGSYILGNPSGVGGLTAVDPITGTYADWWGDPNGEVTSLLVANQKLIAGGTFTSMSDEDKAGLAVFDMEAPNAVHDFIKKNIQVFPKPANDVLNVRILSLEAESIEFYNVNGIQVKNYFLHNKQEFEIPVSDLSSGIYNLVFRSKNGSIVKSELVPIVR